MLRSRDSVRAWRQIQGSARSESFGDSFLKSPPALLGVAGGAAKRGVQEMHGAALTVLILLGIVIALICAVVCVEISSRQPSRGRHSKRTDDPDSLLPTTAAACSPQSSYFSLVRAPCTAAQPEVLLAAARQGWCGEPPVCDVVPGATSLVPGTPQYARSMG